MYENALQMALLRHLQGVSYYIRLNHIKNKKS